MKRIFLFIVSLSFFSCDEETPIKDNFVVKAFLFQGEKVDDIKEDTRSINDTLLKMNNN